MTQTLSRNIFKTSCFSLNYLKTKRFLHKRTKISPAVRIYRGNFCKFSNVGKELDAETGLYYFGARYLDPKTSRWLGVDPAMGEYLPSAPVNEEAKKRNGNLPGMGGVFNYVNLHVYHYAGNNPVKYVDPDGRDIDAVFTITKIEKTEYGIKASGILYIRDNTTGEEISTPAYSGGILNDPNDDVSLPLPIGEYDILNLAPAGYRLEAKDSIYGNDIVDGVDPRQETIRLHGPGVTYGCLAVENKNDFEKIENILANTSTTKISVPRKSILGDIGFNESQTKYGKLTVTTLDNSIYHSRMR